MKEKVQEFFSKQSKKVKQKIRDKAIENAKETSIRYGKKVEDFSHEEWRKIVKEEEEKLVERMWKTGGLGMVLMGFMPWW
ncbi:hypothetical protein M9B42_04905 [SAR86 cluster bacterium]|jgi:hypothetical protein|nr:hypothetical protein M9B42_04905 [SAR86 cluster bacterium]